MQGDYTNPDDFRGLASRMHALEQDLGRDVQRLFYVSTPPTVFNPILENIGASGLARYHLNSPLASKVIIEKTLWSRSSFGTNPERHPRQGVR